MTDLYQSLLNASFRFVSYRPRSKKEIADFLKKKLKKWKQIDISLLDKVIARLEELGYVDDEKFAAWWIEQRKTFRPKGAAIIKQELKQKGVIIDGLTDDKNSARLLIEKKLKLLKNLSDFEKKRKLYGFLARRGFSSSVIDDILQEGV